MGPFLSHPPVDSGVFGPPFAITHPPVDPGVFQFHPPVPQQQGLPVPIPSVTDNPGGPGGPLQGYTGPVGHGSPIEAVIARFGIHPNSGLAAAMRAIHAALTQHLANQASEVAQATHGMQGHLPGHPAPLVGRGLHEPGQLFFNPSHHSAPVAPVRPGPILQ